MWTDLNIYHHFHSKFFFFFFSVNKAFGFWCKLVIGNTVKGKKWKNLHLKARLWIIVRDRDRRMNVWEKSRVPRSYLFGWRITGWLVFSVFLFFSNTLKRNENGHLRNRIYIQERFCPRKGLSVPYELLKVIPSFQTKYNLNSICWGQW